MTTRQQGYRCFATFLWSEVASLEVVWQGHPPPTELLQDAGLGADEQVRHGQLARSLRTRYGPWLTFPKGSNVLCTDHELVYVELPRDPVMLYAMCGLAFSGKSTFARQVAERIGAMVVSLDAILAERGLYGGEGLPIEEWERASCEAVDRIRTLAGKGRPIILDDTCSRRFLRERYRELADELDLGFLVIYLDVPLETVRARIAHAARTATRRIINPNVFEAHLASFEPPEADEAVERFRDEETARRWIDAVASAIQDTTS
jgi:predicted kinase